MKDFFINLPLLMMILHKVLGQNDKGLLTERLLTLPTGPKSNHVKQVLGSILNPTLDLESNRSK